MKNEKQKTDLRIDRTQAMLREGMLKLLREMPFSAITVKMLAETATINRKTFYAHYRDKDALLEEMFREMDSELCGCLMHRKKKPESEPDIAAMQSDLARYLNAILHYRARLEYLYTDETTPLGLRVLNEEIDRRQKDLFLTADKRGKLPAQLWHAKLVGFFLATCDWWLDQTEYTTAEGAELLCRSMLVSEAGVFRYAQAGSGRLKNNQKCTPETAGAEAPETL